jgi:hypothetical protein
MKIMNFIDDIIGIIITTSLIFLTISFAWYTRRNRYRDLFSIKDIDERNRLRMIYNMIIIFSIIVAVILLGLLSYLVTDLVEFLFS